jgi:hypothetical protein
MNDRTINVKLLIVGAVGVALSQKKGGDFKQWPRKHPGEAPIYANAHKSVLLYSQWGLIPRPLRRLELVNTHEKW